MDFGNIRPRTMNLAGRFANKSMLKTKFQFHAIKKFEFDRHGLLAQGFVVLKSFGSEYFRFSYL